MLEEEELLESSVNKLPKETVKRARTKKQSQFKESWMKKKKELKNFNFSTPFCFILD